LHNVVAHQATEQDESGKCKRPDKSGNYIRNKIKQPENMKGGKKK